MQSLDHNIQNKEEINCISQLVLDEALLMKMTVLQRKSVMMEILCQAIESQWVNDASEESQKLSSEAIKLIMNHYEGYIKNILTENKYIVEAARLSNQAISISNVGVSFGMSYKISELYQIEKGQAVSICLPEVWLMMLDKLSVMSKNKVAVYEKLLFAFDNIADSMRTEDIIQALLKYQNILNKMKFPKVTLKSPGQIKTLVASVGKPELENHPIKFTNENLKMLYECILK